MMDVQPIRTAELLQLWEYGQGQPPVRRALALLSAACPERSLTDLAALPIGQRDGLLLKLRERTFGPRLTVTAHCPQCDEKLELELIANDLLSMGESSGISRSTEGDRPEAEVGSVPFTLASGDWRVAFRLPASRDLLALPLPGEGDLRAMLLASCVLFVWQNEKPGDPGDLSEEVISKVLAAMAEADPLAEIRLALTCPACAHSWKPILDPLAYFWEELESWAAGLLQEIHLLARAYGWNEAEILALSPWRRRAYLEIVNR
jgi:hypothetical protein